MSGAPLERDSPESAPGRARTLSRLVLGLTLAVGLVVVVRTHADYGPTWDEGVQARYGQLALAYFASGGQDRSCNEYLDLRFYGPLVEMVPALFAPEQGPEKYAVRHLFLGLLSLASLPAVWLFGRTLGGPTVAAFSLLAVATMPRFYAHGFNNSKDASFALAVMWSMAALAAMFRSPRVRWPRVAWCGVAVGLGLCARPGGFPLFGLFVGCGAAAWFLTRDRDAGERPGAVAIGLLPRLVAVFVVAWAIMVSPWPWAHESPLWNPIEAIRVAAEFPTTVPVLFDGEIVSSATLPWDYLTRYIWIATPEPVLALASIGLVLGVRDQLANWRTRRARTMLITQVWFFAPLALFVLLRPNIHGGIRHFLFVLPALGVLAAYGAEGVLRLARGPRPRAVAALLLALALAWPVGALVRLHPYQVAYYNALSGGVGAASGRDWTDYYLSSYAEAVRWVNARAAEAPGRSVDVLVAAGPSVMMWVEELAGPNVSVAAVTSLSERPERLEADYFITSTRFGTGLFPDSPVVHSIGRGGAVFTVLKGREGAPSE